MKMKKQAMLILALMPVLASAEEIKLTHEENVANCSRIKFQLGQASVPIDESFPDTPIALSFALKNYNDSHDRQIDIQRTESKRNGNPVVTWGQDSKESCSYEIKDDKMYFSDGSACYYKTNRGVPDLFCPPDSDESKAQSSFWPW